MTTGTTWAEHQRLGMFRRDGLVERLAPFAAVALFAYALAPAIHLERPWLVVASAVLTVLVIAAALALPWDRWPRGAESVVPVAYVGSVALLIFSGPNAASAFEVLLGVPVLWTALYGLRSGIVAVFLAALALLILDGAFVDVGTGAPNHWADLLTHTAVGALVAWSAMRVVASLHRRERILHRVANLTRDIDAPGRLAAACHALVEVAAADVAVVVVAADSATPVAWAGDPGSGRVAPVAPATAEEVHEALARDHSVIKRHDGSAYAASLIEPMVVDGRRLGAFIIGWTSPRPVIDDLVHSAVRLVVAAVGGATIRAQRMDDLDELSRTDALTGLANRREWDTSLPHELMRARRSHAPLTVAMGDIDHFKRFNDTRGHQAGDRLLTELGRRWNQRVRATDVLARYGGEEFVLALPDCLPAAALALVEKLRAAVPEGQTCSFGLALWDGEESGERLVARADRALYAAKTAGCDRALVDGPPGEAARREAETAAPSAGRRALR